MYLRSDMSMSKGLYVYSLKVGWPSGQSRLTRVERYRIVYHLAIIPAIQPLIAVCDSRLMGRYTVSMGTDASNPSYDGNDENSGENEDLTNEEVQGRLREKLDNYTKALAEEFEENQKEKPEEVIENTLEFFKGHVPTACAQIVHLMNHSTSDAVRSANAKYIIERVFKGAVDSPTDPVKDILAGLMKQDPAPGIIKNKTGNS
jgi:hypothetical protein